MRPNRFYAYQLSSLGQSNRFYTLLPSRLCHRIRLFAISLSTVVLEDKQRRSRLESVAQKMGGQANNQKEAEKEALARI